MGRATHQIRFLNMTKAATDSTAIVHVMVHSTVQLREPKTSAVADKISVKNVMSMAEGTNLTHNFHTMNVVIGIFAIVTATVLTDVQLKGLKIFVDHSAPILARNAE